ncbi:MAG: hypothetical protein ABIA75_08955 [Candidatus Neomarinimicrobiota bacterium]
MRRILLFCMTFLMLGLMAGCSNTDESLCDFGLYLLADTTLSYAEIADKSLGKLKLQDNPVIISEDIQSYEVLYSSDSTYSLFHRMVVTAATVDKLGSEIIPYVVKVGSNRIYLGEYWPQLMSIMAQTVTMVNMAYVDLVFIANNDTGAELINDFRIVAALEQGGVEIVYEDISN